MGVPNHYKDPLSECNNKQFEGTDMEEEPPNICALVVMGCLLCIFCIPGTAVGFAGSVVFYPCVCCCMFAVEGDIPNYFQFWAGCALGCMMVPTFIVMVIVVMIWMFITGIYAVFSSIFPCLPPCSPRVERWWENHEE